MKNVVTDISSRLLALALAAAVAGTPSALAQSSRRYDPSETQRRIERSGELQRQALQGLGDPTRAEQLVQKAYDELQAALHAMVINASGQKFPDPLLGVNTRKSQEALYLLQRAADELRTHHGSRPRGLDQEGNSPETPAGSRPYLDAVRSNLEQALRLTSTVLVF